MKISSKIGFKSLSLGDSMGTLGILNVCINIQGSKGCVLLPAIYYTYYYQRKKFT